MAEEKKEYVPIYYESPEKAFRESVTGPEANAFRASFSATEKCTGDIQAALSQNRAGSGTFSSTDFIEGLLDKHGKERVEYCLASYIRSRENESPYFSGEVKAWAHGIRISDSYMIANTILIAGGDDMVNALAENLRGRDIAAEYLEATEGDPGDDGEAAQDDRQEATDAPANGNVVKNEDGSVTVRMPEDAVIRRYQTSAVLCMPRNQGYDMYRYMVDIKCYRENGDGTVSVTLGTNDAHTLTLRRRGQEQKLNADKLCEAFAGATESDYTPERYEVTFPADAVQGNYPNMIRCKFPDSSVYSGQHVVVPTIFKDTEKSNDEKVVFSVPDYINFSVRDEDGNDILIPVSALEREVNGGSYKKRTQWAHVELPNGALLHVYDRHTLFKMPETGEYKGFVYYIPNGMAPADADGTIKVRIPEERKIELKNGMTGEKKELPVKEWQAIVSGKSADDYVVRREDAMNETQKEFVARAEKIRSVMPPEMLEERSWIPVRVRESKLSSEEDTYRSYKFAVAPDKRFSADEAAYKNIGTDFDSAVRAGISAEATLMGYCFDKKSDVVCIELDGCLNGDGTPKTEKAEEILKKLDGSYTEKSVSGTGLHVFGRMTDPNMETLSKDGEAEIFASCGYVALTGDVVKSPNMLSPLDEGYGKEFTEKYFDERKEIDPPTEKDEKIKKAAIAATNGEELEVLLSGGNVRGGKELGDMSLATRLANAAACDAGAVIRLYTASEREYRDPEYVAHLAKRAINASRDYAADSQKKAAAEKDNGGEKMRKTSSDFMER